MKKWIVIFLTIVYMTVFPAFSYRAIAASDNDIVIMNYETSKERIQKGDVFTLEITLKKFAQVSDEIKGVSLYVDKNHESSFEILEKNEYVLATETQHSKEDITYKASLDLKYNGGSSLNIPITIGYVKNGKMESINTSIKIENIFLEGQDTKIYVPKLNIADTSIPTIKAGDTGNLTVSINNTSKYTAKEVLVTPIIGSGDDKSIFYDNLNPSKSIPIILSGNSESVSFRFKISRDASEKTYPIELKYEYSNIYGNTFTSSNIIYIKVVNSGASTKDEDTLPNLEIKNVSYDSDVVLPGKAVNVTINVANSGTLIAKDVNISLQGLKDDGFATVGGTNSKFISKINGKQEIKTSFKLMASDKLAKGSYGLILKINYKDQYGKDYSEEQQFFIPVYSTYTSSKTVPKIILEKYNCNPSIVRAGENFVLNMSFINTSESKEVRNIKIYLTVNEASSDGGSLFTPVNSSNTFFIDRIEPKGSGTKTLEFFTIPDAKAKTYTMVANFEYEDAEGNEYKSTELIGIPVQQKTRLETTEVSFPEEANPGQPIPIGFDFYNMGKVTLNNLMIKLEGDFDSPNSNYFVGNFEPGSNDHYEGTVTPRVPGILKGAIVISYDDPTGQHVELKKDFSFNVVEMPPTPLGPGENPGVEPGEQKQGWFKKILKSPLTWIGAGVVVVAVGIFIRKAIIKRKEGMTLDE